MYVATEEVLYDTVPSFAQVKTRPETNQPLWNKKEKFTTYTYDSMHSALPEIPEEE